MFNSGRTRNDASVPLGAADKEVQLRGVGSVEEGSMLMGPAHPTFAESFPAPVDIFDDSNNTTPDDILSRDQDRSILFNPPTNPLGSLSGNPLVHPSRSPLVSPFRNPSINRDRNPAFLPDHSTPGVRFDPITGIPDDFSTTPHGQRPSSRHRSGESAPDEFLPPGNDVSGFPNSTSFSLRRL